MPGPEPGLLGARWSGQRACAPGAQSLVGDSGESRCTSLLGPREDEELGGGARGASYKRCQAWVGVGQVEPTRWRPR